MQAQLTSASIDAFGISSVGGRRYCQQAIEEMFRSRN